MGCLLTLFIYLCIGLILFVAIKWVCGYAGYTPPQPLVVIIGIVLIMIVVLFIVQCAGLHSFGLPVWRG